MGSAKEALFAGTDLGSSPLVIRISTKNSTFGRPTRSSDLPGTFLPSAPGQERRHGQWKEGEKLKPIDTWRFVNTRGWPTRPPP